MTCGIIINVPLLLNGSHSCFILQPLKKAVFLGFHFYYFFIVKRRIFAT